jgi:uncharacterized membrane protein (GlpM family)
MFGVTSSTIAGLIPLFETIILITTWRKQSVPDGIQNVVSGMINSKDKGKVISGLN